MNFMKLNEKFIFQHEKIGSEIFRFLNKHSQILHVYESAVVLVNSANAQSQKRGTHQEFQVFILNLNLENPSSSFELAKTLTFSSKDDMFACNQNCFVYMHFSHKSKTGLTILDFDQFSSETEFEITYEIEDGHICEKIKE